MQLGHKEKLYGKEDLGFAACDRWECSLDLVDHPLAGTVLSREGRGGARLYGEELRVPPPLRHLSPNLQLIIHKDTNLLHLQSPFQNIF